MYTDCCCRDGITDNGSGFVFLFFSTVLLFPIRPLLAIVLVRMKQLNNCNIEKNDYSFYVLGVSDVIVTLTSNK